MSSLPPSMSDRQCRTKRKQRRLHLQTDNTLSNNW